MVQTRADSIYLYNSVSSVAWPNYLAYIDRLVTQIPSFASHPLLYHELENGWWQRLFSLWHDRHLLTRTKESVLMVSRPRWPLERILLVVRGQKGDETALFRAEQLAQASGAVVAILPIIPAWPVFYQKGNDVQADLDVILQTNTSTGKLLHKYLSRLKQANVPHYFCQQRGTPDQQIRQEVTERAHDIIVIGDEPRGRWHHWYLGEIISPLLRWLDRPLLIAR